MTLSIRPEAVEAAAKAAYSFEKSIEILSDDGLDPQDIPSWEEWKADPSLTEEGFSMSEVLEMQEAAIRAFCEAEGLTEERERRLVTHYGATVPTGRTRLSGPWRPVVEQEEG